MASVKLKSWTAHSRSQICLFIRLHWISTRLMPRKIRTHSKWVHQGKDASSMSRLKMRSRNIGCKRRAIGRTSARSDNSWVWTIRSRMEARDDRRWISKKMTNSFQDHQSSEASAHWTCKTILIGTAAHKRGVLTMCTLHREILSFNQTSICMSRVRTSPSSHPKERSQVSMWHRQ